MVLFKRQMRLIKMERVSRRLLAVLVILWVGIFGYSSTKVWRDSPEMLQRLPAAIFETVKKVVITEEAEQETEEVEEIIPEQIEAPIEAKKYIKIAQKGEGITHLARRTLKEHLQENPQDFELTPEHKIYIEDYIAKKLGGRWLSLGEELEISQDLIDEAIEKSGDLSLQQLQNLQQYSQLVPSLNY